MSAALFWDNGIYPTIALFPFSYLTHCFVLLLSFCVWPRPMVLHVHTSFCPPFQGEDGGAVGRSSSQLQLDTDGDSMTVSGCLLANGCFCRVFVLSPCPVLSLLFVPVQLLFLAVGTHVYLHARGFTHTFLPRLLNAWNQCLPENAKMLLEDVSRNR